MGVPLQVSLSLAFALASIVIAIVAFVPMYISGIDGVTATVDSLRESIDSNLEEALIGYIREPQELNNIMAMQLNQSMHGKPTIGYMDPQQQYNFKHWCFNMLKMYPNILFFSFGTEDGGRQNNESNPTAAPHAGAFLGCQLTRDSGVDTYYWLVRNGTFVNNISAYIVDPVSYNEQVQLWNLPYDPRERGWYMYLRNQQTWTTTYLYQGNSKYAVTAGKPWFSASGELLGVATADYAVAPAETNETFTSFSTALAALKYGKTGVAFAMDKRDGAMLGISWNESLVKTVSGAIAPKNVTELALPMVRKTIKALGSTQANVLAHPAGQFQYGSQWVSVQDIADEYGFAMRVVVIIPEDDFMKEIKEQQRVSIGVVVALIVLVVACGVLFSTAIASVVAELAENMEQCATMRLETVRESKPSNISEISSMQTSFKQMHSNLMEYRNYLPQSVLLAASDVEESECATEQQSQTMTRGGDSHSMASRSHMTQSRATRTSGASTMQQRREKANAVGAALRAGSLNKRMVSVALINVRGFTADLGGAISKEQLCGAHERYVGTVLEMAKASKGVVDGFQGDIVWASWNAASNCGTHAVSCVGSLWQLATQAGDMAVCAAAGTGAVLCGNMGCTGMKKFTCIGRVVPSVALLAKMNNMLDCKVVVEKRLCEEAGSAFYFRMRDVIEYNKATQGALEVHEVHGAKEQQENDEWMYQLEGAEDSDPYTGYNQAFKCIANGRQAEAKQALRKWMGETPEEAQKAALGGAQVEAPFVKYLEGVIERNDRYLRQEVPAGIL